MLLLFIDNKEIPHSYPTKYMIGILEMILDMKSIIQPWTWNGLFGSLLWGL